MAAFILGLPNRFYVCGCCSAYHSVLWHGDCRQDEARFYPENLDSLFGITGWEEVDDPVEQGDGANVN